MNQLAATRIVRLIVADIDGCLMPRRGMPIDLTALGALRQHNQRARENPALAPVCICSGRPQPFVELFAQLIECYVPAVFEWGSGIYLPQEYRPIYSTLISKAFLEARKRLLQTLEVSTPTKTGKWYIQPGKEIAITLYPRPGLTVAQLHEVAIDCINRTGSMGLFEILVTSTHVDLLPFGINKATGVRWLASLLQLGLEEVCGIGDDSSDICLLDVVGFSACPNNSTQAVKNMVQYVSPFVSTNGVLDVIARLTA